MANNGAGIDARGRLLYAAFLGLPSPVEQDRTAMGSTVQPCVASNTDFKVGSQTNSLGTTGLSVTVAWSNDGGATWVYTPVSGAGGAPAGYDRLVTHAQWTFAGSLSHLAPGNAGTVGITTRIR